ncbi:hypothetical protein NLI96_g11028 [Meripilus lineatus]|uniref:F-actin-capping protein subunit alpha n=1 Tax=Meripilus lineatus TaxID=2056292 RepID=A0AAD5USH8_9APHY|nr:hypothetical protein NLI96_g11028 [Physisporinus lineatus]
MPIEPDTESEPFRVALETSCLTYLSAHFHSGVTSVFPTSDNSSRFTIQIVANKYNPNNFWSGRWRSEYIVDLAARSLEGKILVQLATTQTVSLNLPPAITSTNANASASKVIALIETEEGKYQSTLSDAYSEMGEKTFKGLRRALPMTRSKLDWDKVLGYKLGAELSANKGGEIAEIAALAQDQDGQSGEFFQNRRGHRIVDDSLEDWSCSVCTEIAAGANKWDRASPTVSTGIVSRPKSKQRDRKPKTAKTSFTHASPTEVIDLTSDSPPQTSKRLPVAPPEQRDTRFGLSHSTQIDTKPQTRPHTTPGPSAKTFAVPYLEAIVTNTSGSRRSKHSTVSPSPAPIFTPSPRGTSATSTSPPTSPSPDPLHATKVSITPAQDQAKVVCGFVKSGGQLKPIYREPPVIEPSIPPESRKLEQRTIVIDEEVVQDDGMGSNDMDIESSDIEMVDVTEIPVKVEPMDSMDDSLPRIPWHEKGKGKESPPQVATRVTSSSIERQTAVPRIMSMSGDDSTAMDVTSTRPRKMKKTKKLGRKHREKLAFDLVRGEVVLGHI